MLQRHGESGMVMRPACKSNKAGLGQSGAVNGNGKKDQRQCCGRQAMHQCQHARKKRNPGESGKTGWRELEKTTSKTKTAERYQYEQCAAG